MIELFVNLFSSFILGLLAPLTAVCVLPLYPGFLAYLSNQVSDKSNKKSIFLFGITISLGVIAFMFLLGLIFTTIFQVSLTNVIGIISPIAFSILGILSIMLIVDYDLGKFFPKINISILKNPWLSAFSYGFFFGGIIIPCNPLFIAVLFARSAIETNFLGNMGNFLTFGIGISFPLILFLLVSIKKSSQIIGFVTKNKRKINLIAGSIMLVISVYYLVFVFRILG